MKIDKIITLASADVQWQFMAMERSLRACGCDLPLLVIPYDDQKTFDLPANASWWKMDEVMSWLQQYNTFPALRKYQCLLTDNYQYVDSDIVFLRNPQEVLAGQKGFITSCGHWNNTGHTCTS